MHELINLRQLIQPQQNAIAMASESMPNESMLSEPSYNSKPLLTLLHINSQIRVFHWQTDSYAQHTAFGDYYTAMDELIDTFVESYQGKYCRIDLGAEENFDIALKGYYLNHLDIFLEEVIQYLQEILPSTFESDDTELCNIIDEMVSETNKLKYLLTLT